MRKSTSLRIASTLVVALIMAHAAPAFAQRAFDCGSDDAKKIMLRAFRHHHGDPDPYPGVMGWWPRLLSGLRMVATKTGNRMPTRQYTIDGKNYAHFLDRAPSRHLNLYVKGLDPKANVRLGVTACTYTLNNGNAYLAKLDDLKLFDSRKLTVHSADKPEGGAPGVLLQLASGKHTSSGNDSRRPYTVLILSPSYFTGSHKWEVSYGVGGEF
jgi:hypothetical protein